MQIHFRRLLSRLEKLKTDTRQLNIGNTNEGNLMFPFLFRRANIWDSKILKMQ